MLLTGLNSKVTARTKSFLLKVWSRHELLQVTWEIKRRRLSAPPQARICISTRSPGSCVPTEARSPGLDKINQEAVHALNCLYNPWPQTQVKQPHLLRPKSTQNSDAIRVVLLSCQFIQVVEKPSQQQDKIESCKHDSMTQPFQGASCDRK